MLVQSHDSGDFVARQGLSLVEDSWALEVVPRLPANLAAEAGARSRPFSGCEALRPHTTACGVYWLMSWAPSTRRLGAWAVLVGVADISEAAWRKRSVRVARGCSGA